MADVFQSLRRVVEATLVAEMLSKPPTHKAGNLDLSDGEWEARKSRRQEFRDLLHDCEVAAVESGYAREVVKKRIGQLDKIMLKFIGGETDSSMYLDTWRTHYIEECRTRKSRKPNVDAYFKIWESAILKYLELVERMAGTKSETKKNPEVFPRLAKLNFAFWQWLTDRHVGIDLETLKIETEAREFLKYRRIPGKTTKQLVKSLAAAIRNTLKRRKIG